jgi:thiol-disulfide isomerase/thioredoxin
MHIRRSICGLLSLSLVVCGLSGCSQTGGFWPAANANNDVKTVASVGDKPLSIRSGESGSSLRVEADEPSTPTPVGAGGTKITGRVFDETNQPVANARVRLVDGSAAGGRAMNATTDKSGAFTLHGLRRGSAYTVIAEYQDQDGFLSGHTEARAPETNVKISLRPRGTEAQPRKTTIRPAKARTETPIPSGNFDDDETVAPQPSVTRRSRPIGGDADLANEESVSLPVANREDVASNEDDSPSSTVRAGYSGRQRIAANARANRSSSQPILPADDADADLPRTRKSAKAKQPSVDEDEIPASRARNVGGSRHPADDDGENPLPPALEPEAEADAAPARSASRSGAGARTDEVEEPVRVSRIPYRGKTGAAASQRPVEEPTGDDIVIDGPGEREPRPIPEEILPSVRASGTADAAAADAIAPAVLTGVATGKRATTAAKRTRRAPAKPAAESPVAEPADSVAPADSAMEPNDAGETQSSSRKPTWRELSHDQAQVPLDESLRRSSGDTANTGRTVLALHRTDNTATRSRAATPGGASPLLAVTGAAAPEHVRTRPLCQVDPSTRKVLDLVLPGLDGALVSIQDIDADVILLDFWGSWCKPCRTSIPHLAELQEQFGGKRLQVIGIACERPSSLKERQAAAAQAAKELGINYRVLLSSMDGTCPVQKALQVQFYPTMIVLDRNGRILAREHGATDATLFRTDRAIFAALRSSDTGNYE